MKHNGSNGWSRLFQFATLGSTSTMGYGSAVEVSLNNVNGETRGVEIWYLHYLQGLAYYHCGDLTKPTPDPPTPPTPDPVADRKREMRSAWLATVFCMDWPKDTDRGTSAESEAAMKADMIAYLDAFKAANLNTVHFQVRSMCDAMYQSSYEPWSSYLTGARGTAPSWDPLAFVVEEGHKRGLRVEAWVNPYRFSKGAEWNAPEDAEAKLHLLSYTNGDNTISILDPAQDWTINRITNVCKEIITNYNVDGLVFDDYFYPEGIPTTSAAGDYVEWQNSGTSMTMADWRRDNVNRMVKAVYQMVQANRADCTFGVSPAGAACTDASVAAKHGVEPLATGAYDWQYNGIFSDPVQWLEDASIDYISPQLYWSMTHPTNAFGALTEWWTKVAKQFGRHHYASQDITGSINKGIDPGDASTYEEILNQVSANRACNTDASVGSVLFSAKYLKDMASSESFNAYLAQNVFTRVALPPVLTWKEKANYAKPENLGKNEAGLSWSAVSQDALCRYAVYAVPANTTLEGAQGTEGGIHSAYLLGVTYGTSFELPADKQSGFWYAVTAIDAAHNEYDAATLGAPDPEEVEYREDPVGDLAGLGYFHKKGENGLWYFRDLTNAVGKDFVVLHSFDDNYKKYEGFKDNYFLKWILEESGCRAWYVRKSTPEGSISLPYWPSIKNGAMMDSDNYTYAEHFTVGGGFVNPTAHDYKLVMLPVEKDEEFAPKGLAEFTTLDFSTYGTEIATGATHTVNGVEVPLYYFTGVEDLTGLGYFTALTKLNVSHQRYGYNTGATNYVTADGRQYTQHSMLSSADLSRNTLLEEVYLDYNSLTSLDVTKLGLLRVLNVSTNAKLASLDISQNTSLADLRLEHDWEFMHLKADATNNRNMKYLQIFDTMYGYNQQTGGMPNNAFQTEVIDQMPNLEVLHAFSMYIDKLDVSGLKNLRSLWLHKSQWGNRQYPKGNWLHTLDLSQNLELRDLHVQNMHLASLNINSPYLGEDYGYEPEVEIVGANTPGVEVQNNYRRISADLAKYEQNGKYFYVYYLRTQRLSSMSENEPMLIDKQGNYQIHHYDHYEGDHSEANETHEMSISLDESLQTDGFDPSRVSNWRIANPVNEADLATKGVLLHSVATDATVLPVVNSSMASKEDIPNFTYLSDWNSNDKGFAPASAMGEIVVLKAIVSTSPLSGAPTDVPAAVCYDYDMRGEALREAQQGEAQGAKRKVNIANAEKYVGTFYLDIAYPDLESIPTDVIDTMAGEKQVESVTYTDVAGRMSARPFSGMNIITFHYSDGTSKVVKKVLR
ncbi:MAG: family 10 glycosylhydrolase [Bacteroidales bacterium]|nr:family 10 glycosylhydrolase [Bacteroidales bacterium]